MQIVITPLIILLYREITKQYESKKQEIEEVRKLNFDTFIQQIEIEHIPQKDDESDDELQAELEAKFDELFGSES